MDWGIEGLGILEGIWEVDLATIDRSESAKDDTG
jgi:hypothetical protein